MNKNLLNVLPGDDVLSQCIHCGLCLSVCPTYEITKLERSSPRGRIKLIKSVARGELPLSDTFSYEMNFCLDCQACETACPAGVKYGSIVEAARVEVNNSVYGSSLKERIKKLILNKIFTSKRTFRLTAKLLYFYQKSGIQKFLHSSGLFRIFFPKLSEIDRLSPPVSRSFSDEVIPEYSVPEGTIKYKTAFLSGCLMNVMFADINIDTVDVLKACGCSVYTPKGQVCCGSLHAHNGEMETAKKLARLTIDTFLTQQPTNHKPQQPTNHKPQTTTNHQPPTTTNQPQTTTNQPPTTNHQQYDYLVSNSAGCGAFMKEYVHLLKDDPEYAEKAEIFSSKVRDFTEFLNELKIHLPLNKIDAGITYHDACHLAHTQKVTAEPREVINSVPGIKYTELEESLWCCGSAGIYNLMQYDTSMIILKRKMENIKKINPGIVITGNPGCIGQLRYGAEKFGVPVEVLHPATLLKRALGS
jgi:glycolate oxidase iron-sulfur subunit